MEDEDESEEEGEETPVVRKTKRRSSKAKKTVRTPSGRSGRLPQTIEGKKYET